MNSVNANSSNSNQVTEEEQEKDKPKSKFLWKSARSPGRDHLCIETNELKLWYLRGLFHDVPENYHGDPEALWSRNSAKALTSPQEPAICPECEKRRIKKRKQIEMSLSDLISTQEIVRCLPKETKKHLGINNKDLFKN